MLANGGDTEGLFRAAVMESGYPTTLLFTSDMAEQTRTYEAFAQQVGCGNSTNKLECMRQAPYTTIKAAIDASVGFYSYQVRWSCVCTENAMCGLTSTLMQTFHLCWSPRVDGSFLTDLPSRLLQQGKIANVPVITGVRI